LTETVHSQRPKKSSRGVWMFNPARCVPL